VGCGANRSDQADVARGIEGQRRRDGAGHGRTGSEDVAWHDVKRALLAWAKSMQ